MKSESILVRLWLLAFFTTFAFGATATEAPTGPVILEISGAISNSNGDNVMRYDREMLEALGPHEITTETPWTDGSATFSGILLQDLMTDVGANGLSVKATALNDYSVDIPIADFRDYGVILALQKDGNYLTVRDRGPLWVIYPWSDRKALQNELYYSRSIWQLKALEVEPN